MRALLLIGGLALLASGSAFAQTFKSGCNIPSITTAVALWTCRNAEMHSYLAGKAFPFMDLQVANESAHLANANNFDTRRITPAEWLATDDKIDAEFKTDLERRTAAVMQSQATQRPQADVEAQARHSQLCAAAGLLGSNRGTIGGRIGDAYRAQAYCEAGLPPPPPPVIYQPAPAIQMPTTTDCYRSGVNVTCTTR